MNDLAEKVRAIAIYLPQFHPIPENDAWWGKGFTEWTNVTKARPLFRGHHQPQLPTDLGFYDLRLPEVREQQADMARANGVHGFCYYHYWFNGKIILGRPFQEVLATGKPDFPFMLCWANESWSRTWMGAERELLIKQVYSVESHRAHAEFLVRAFRDPRYIRIDGRPAFVIYRALEIPDVGNMLGIIRDACMRILGVNPYLIASNSHAFRAREKLLGLDFDAILNFLPQLSTLPNALKDRPVARRILSNAIKQRTLNWKTKVYSYADAVSRMVQVEPTDDFRRVLPSVFVGWDNTPRRGRAGIVMTDNDPKVFEKELVRVKQKILGTPGHPRVMFINAWNEWAEGNHLEPDQKYGGQHLAAVKRVFAS